MVPTYIDIEKVFQDINKCEIKFPLIAKPKNGSASLGIVKINSIEEVEIYFKVILKNLLFNHL